MKGYKMSEEHKRKIGLANSISLKGHTINQKQRNALEYGRQFAHTPEANKKRVQNRIKNGTFLHSKRTKEKIKKKLKEVFPNGRPINSGSFKKRQKPWNTGLTKEMDRRVFKLSENNGAKKLSTKIKLSCRHQGIAIKEWSKFLTVRKYPEEFDNQIKEYIRNIYGRKCAECNYTEKRLGYKLSVHHIDYNKNNNTLNNLVPLCRSCHAQTSYGRNDWSNYFRGKITRGE